MLKDARYIVKYIIGLMVHGDEAWESLSKEDNEAADHEYMMTHYYWPLFGVSALLIMLLIGIGGLFGDTSGSTFFDLEVGMRAMVEFAVVYAVGPMLVAHLAPAFFGYANMQIDRNKLNVFVPYTMSVLMVLEVCCATFPNLEALHFSQLYIIAVITQGVDHYLKVERNRRVLSTMMFCVLFYLALQLLPFLFNIFDKL